MKKIDFHIHTVATAVDAAFTFDIAKLQEYIEVMQLDGIAITNHNMFDRAQFDTIANTLSITVLPGIEINLGKGHALLIANSDNLDDFTAKCSKVDQLVKTAEDSIDVAKLREIYGDLSQYLIIPHYDKKPAVDQASLTELGADFIVGEVTSSKKFMYALKDSSLPTPMLLSDSRAKAEWDFKTRQTYLDVSSIDTGTIRRCLADRSKVALSHQEGNSLIQVTPDGTVISSGLTVVLGGRSSGKSYTLDDISKYNDNIKYIKQFELIETDSEKEAERFNERVGKKQQEDGDKYLRQFRGVIDEVKNISLKNDDRKVEDYVASLLKNASEIERQDLYSKAAMFSETEIVIESNEKIGSLIKATQDLLSPGKYADIVDEEVGRDHLVSLLHRLIEIYRVETLTRNKQIWVNELVKSVKASLSSLSAVTPVKDINLLEVARNRAKVKRFTEVTKELQKPRIIAEKTVRRFTIQEESVAISRAQDLKDISKTRASFMDAFNHYDDPYAFLQSLMAIGEVDATSYYRFFTKIEYSIINEYGAAVSGGERAEFKLINEIDGASTYDLLLLDEPESSFDNLFLSSDVNLTIKEIAKTTPVVVVTHNNTIGASIKPDYLIYTERTIVDGIPQYRVYSGRATDKELVSVDGMTISNSEVTLKYLEAGKDQYQERGRMYEMLEN